MKSSVGECHELDQSFQPWELGLYLEKVILPRNDMDCNALIVDFSNPKSGSIFARYLVLIFFDEGNKGGRNYPANKIIPVDSLLGLNTMI